MKNERIIEIICALLVGIFIYAATSKLFNFPLFVAQLDTHPYLKPFAGLVAWIVPVTELLISLLLLIPSIRKMGLYGSAALLIIFTIYICSMLLSGKPLPCSCGGFISTLNWREHLGFNGVLILLSIVGIWLKRKSKIFYKGSAVETQSVRTV